MPYHRGCIGGVILGILLLVPISPVAAEDLSSYSIGTSSISLTIPPHVELSQSIDTQGFAEFCVKRSHGLPYRVVPAQGIQFSTSVNGCGMRDLVRVSKNYQSILLVEPQ